MLTLLLSLLVLITVACLIASLLIGASALAFFVVRVPYVPSPHGAVGRTMDELEVKAGEVFYDLGCGDGRYIIAAADRGAKAVGFEIAPWAYLKAAYFTWRVKSKAQIIFGNFYKANLRDADAVFCFLLDTVMPKVSQKLRRDLKPGARIASYGFPLPDWKPVRVVEFRPNDKRASKLFLYKK